MPVLRPSIMFQRARILPSPPTSRRLLHQTAAARRPPYKDDMDRESLKPKAHENTQSGTDEEVAVEHSDAAFNPRKTAPETEKKAAAEGAAQKGKQTDPLASSPADHDFAKGGGAEGEGKSTRGADKNGKGNEKEKSSGAGNPPKAGKA